MNLTKLSAIERKRKLVVEENLLRVTGKGETPYTPREHYRSNKMYLTDDTVVDGNGDPYTALQDSRNKPPANNPLFWKPDIKPEVKRWSDIPVGTAIAVGLEVIHNSADWVCVSAHTKTAGNAPRQGSDLWAKK